MKKYVSEKSNYSAWIILKKEKIVGKVQAHFSQSEVTVNVWDYSKDKSFQEGYASGYGYDRLISAMAGCTIDGIQLTDHCETNKKTELLLKNYIKAAQKENFTKEKEKHYIKKVKLMGANFCNWATFYNGIVSYNFEGNKNKAIKTAHFTSLHLTSGLKRLELLGYIVIQAI